MMGNKPPLDVQLARLDHELRNAQFQAEAGNAASALISIRRAQALLDQIREG